MSLNRFCVPLHAGLEEMWIDGPEAHHMLHVKRLGSGDRIVLFDGMGKECDAEIVEVSDNKVKVKIGQIKIVNKENNVGIDIAFAIPKGKRSHFLIQKCTELGVRRLIPLHYERSVVRFKAGDSGKIEKWEKIAIEASKQCGRNVLTDICGAMDFSSILKNVKDYDLSLFACNQPGSDNLKNILQEKQKINSIISFIGPEGGFTSREIDMAKDAGCKFVSFGQRTLRVETAAIAISAILYHHFSDQLCD